MTERTNNPLRDKATSNALKRIEDQANTLRRTIMHEYAIVGAQVTEALDRGNPLAHTRLYSEVCANIDAARQAVAEAGDSLRTAARLMNPDLTNVSDYEEDLS